MNRSAIAKTMIALLAVITRGVRAVLVVKAPFTPQRKTLSETNVILPDLGFHESRPIRHKSDSVQ